ncbi:MAG: hypothetical protein HQL56_00865 [Magnetococcales bacterium]|nr:hypothetical protein [Magnetococcales bacterium]
MNTARLAGLWGEAVEETGRELLGGVLEVVPLEGTPVADWCAVAGFSGAFQGHCRLAGSVRSGRRLAMYLSKRQPVEVARPYPEILMALMQHLAGDFCRVSQPVLGKVEWTGTTVIRGNDQRVTVAPGYDAGRLGLKWEGYDWMLEWCFHAEKGGSPGA